MLWYVLHRLLLHVRRVLLRRHCFLLKEHHNLLEGIGIWSTTQVSGVSHSQPMLSHRLKGNALLRPLPRLRGHRTSGVLGRRVGATGPWAPAHVPGGRGCVPSVPAEMLFLLSHQEDTFKPSSLSQAQPGSASSARLSSARLDSARLSSARFSSARLSSSRFGLDSSAGKAAGKVSPPPPLCQNIQASQDLTPTRFTSSRWSWPSMMALTRCGEAGSVRKHMLVTQNRRLLCRYVELLYTYHKGLDDKNSDKLPQMILRTLKVTRYRYLQ